MSIHVRPKCIYCGRPAKYRYAPTSLGQYLCGIHARRFKDSPALRSIEGQAMTKDSQTYSEGFNEGWRAAREITPLMVEKAAIGIWMLSNDKPWDEASKVLRLVYQEQAKASLHAAFIREAEDQPDFKEEEE